MTFSYDPSTNIGKVRREIHDIKDASITPGAGIFPDGENVSDEDIAYYLQQANDSIIGAALSVLTVVANAYSIQATEVELGPFRESYKEVLVNLRRQINMLERRYDEEKRSNRIKIATSGTSLVQFS